MTPDEIAREAADGLIVLRKRQPPSTTFEVALDGRPIVLPATVFCPQQYYESVRPAVERAILAAIERALRCVPVPGGLSEEELVKIDQVIRWTANVAAVPSNEDATLAAEVLPVLLDLRDHAGHLARILQDASADGQLDQWRAGYEAGVKAEREKALEPRGDS